MISAIIVISLVSTVFLFLSAGTSEFKDKTIPNIEVVAEKIQPLHEDVGRPAQDTQNDVEAIKDDAADALRAALLFGFFWLVSALLSVLSGKYVPPSGATNRGVDNADAGV